MLIDIGCQASSQQNEDLLRRKGGTSSCLCQSILLQRKNMRTFASSGTWSKALIYREAPRRRQVQSLTPVPRVVR